MPKLLRQGAEDIKKIRNIMNSIAPGLFQKMLEIVVSEDNLNSPVFIEDMEKDDQPL